MITKEVKGRKVAFVKRNGTDENFVNQAVAYRNLKVERDAIDAKMSAIKGYFGEKFETREVDSFKIEDEKITISQVKDSTTETFDVEACLKENPHLAELFAKYTKVSKKAGYITIRI